MRIRVSSIQHFSTGDGPGIRTTVFLKGCNLRCPWCHNPETISSETTKLCYPNREIINGSWMEVNAIINEAMEDADFYGEDGGVTISGGEPLLQPEPLSELVYRLKENGISVIIDTAGCVPYSRFVELGNDVDTFFFDLKAADEIGYKAVGGDFKLVRNNLLNLISGGYNVRVRIPLIPKFNDSPQYSQRMCEVLKSVGATRVDLLPFHRLGSGKYEALGLKYAYKNTEPMTIAHAQEIAKIYGKYFDVKVEK